MKQKIYSGYFRLYSTIYSGGMKQRKLDGRWVAEIDSNQIKSFILSCVLLSDFTVKSRAGEN